MNGLDVAKKVIKLAPISVDDFDGKGSRVIAPPREVPYDTLVLAVGGVSNSFGTPGVDEHCVKLDAPKDAEFLRKRILSQALSVSMGTSPQPKLRIGIVGGGATGVELAAEIHHTICTLRSYGANLFEEQLQITIMEGGPRILGGGDPSLSTFATKELKKRRIDVRTSCFIKAVTPTGFLLQDGTLLEKDIRIWTAGIKAPDWLSTLGLKTNKFNQILTDGELAVGNSGAVFALGDCAAVPFQKVGEKPKNSKGPPPVMTPLFLPATAQVAHQQAEWLASKLEARLTSKTCPPFTFKPQGMLVSLGEGKAVGSLAAIVGPQRDYYVQGRGAKLLYSSLYRMHQAVLYGWTRAGLLFIGDKLRHVALPQLKLH
ncbi:NADH dehydrogenase isoform X2 [Folsomia candida]|nr:NADH dehydrogenase isoform X2 [Folsomia candida]